MTIPELRSLCKHLVIVSVVVKKRSYSSSVASMGTFITCILYIFIFVFRVLSRKKEGRKRNLNFHLPAVVAFSSNLRLIQTDSSYIALGDIYDLHCERNGFSREEPLLYGADKCRKVLRDFRDQSGRQVRHQPVADLSLIFSSPPNQSISLARKAFLMRLPRR